MAWRVDLETDCSSLEA